MESVIEEPQRVNLPSGYQEVKTSGKTLRLTRNEIPWMNDAEQAVPLRLVRLQGTGTEFYLGSLVTGKNVLKASAKLSPHQQQVSNNLFYANLVMHIEQGRLHTRAIDKGRAAWSIYQFANRAGIRVNFVEPGEIDGKRVIIKIAAYDKADQPLAYRQITSARHKEIKQRGKV